MKRQIDNHGSGEGNKKIKITRPYYIQHALSHHNLTNIADLKIYLDESKNNYVHGDNDDWLLTMDSPYETSIP